MQNDRPLISFDWALKSILRQKDNFDILEGFLTDLLDEPMTIVDLLESESNQMHEKEKYNRVDLKARDSEGREVIIEIQHQSETDYLSRVYFGTAKAMVDSMQEGYRFAKVAKVISISIVYWNLLSPGYVVKGEMVFKNLTDQQPVIVKESKNVFAEYYFIQPMAFKDHIKNKLDEWVYMFKHSKVKGDIPATNMEKAQSKLDRLRMTQAEYKAYTDYLFEKTINENVIKSKFDEGREEGREEGHAKGLEEGHTKGLEEGQVKGREEERNAIMVALKKSGMTDEAIHAILQSSSVRRYPIGNLWLLD